VHWTVNPSQAAGGVVRVPGDKSISHRALMLGSIAEGESRIRNFLPGEDCRATLAAMRRMGVAVDEPDATSLIVHGAGRRGLEAPFEPLDMQNSGTAMRLLAGLLSGQSFISTLTGDASLSRRPMGRIIEPLSRMGARIESNGGLPPLIVHGAGTLAGIEYALPVASAQVKSAILLAGLYADGDVAVTEPATTRDHTERMLLAMGVALETGGGRIAMRGGQGLAAADIEVPGDLSSAAFLVVAALVAAGCEAVIKGVGVNPTRTGAISILRQMGADIAVENERLAGHEPVADLRVRASDLRGIDVDPSLVSLAIDEFPVLFVAAAAARGRTRFTGIAELRLKESDRIGAMAAGLARLGIRVEEIEDGAVVYGGRFTGGSVDSCGDHRVAMAFAVAGSIAEAPVRVLDTAAVGTSFPGFVDCVRGLGLDVMPDRESSAA
jgi:3-phosphoshikimate 1-carboxyvinyltransferase